MERKYIDCTVKPDENGYIYYKFVDGDEVKIGKQPAIIDGNPNQDLIAIMDKVVAFKRGTHSAEVQPKQSATYEPVDTVKPPIKKKGRLLGLKVAAIIAGLIIAGIGFAHYFGPGFGPAETTSDADLENDDIEVEVTEESLAAKVAEVKEIYRPVIDTYGLTEDAIVNAVNVANIDSIRSNQELFDRTFGDIDGMSAIASANDTFSSIRGYVHDINGADRPLNGIKSTGNWDHYKEFALSNFLIDTRPNNNETDILSRMQEMESEIVRYGEIQNKFGADYDYVEADNHVQRIIALGYNIQEANDGAGLLVSYEMPTVGKMAQHNNLVTGQYGDKTLNTVRAATSSDLDTLAEGGLVLSNIIPNIDRACVPEPAKTKVK